MPDFSNRGPLGQKQPKPPKLPRKPLPKVSPKKRARKAAERARGAWEHMAAVKALPCICCGATGPSDAHHVVCDKQARSDWRVIPLCYECHRGPNGIHAAKRTWVSKHGPDNEFLVKVSEMLDK
jgi:hypothetical protein